MTTPAEHAATELRELAARMPDAESDQSRDWCVDCGEWVQEHGIALAERAKELESERDSIMADAVKNIDYWKDKEYKQRERAEQLERERYSGDDMAEAFQRGRLAERNERDSARQAAVAHMENLLSAEKARAEQLEREMPAVLHERNMAQEELSRVEIRAEQLERECQRTRDEWAEAENTLRERAEQLETALLAIKHHPDTPEHIRAFAARAALDGGTATPDDSPFEQPAIEASEAGFYRDGKRIRFGRRGTATPETDA